MNPRYIAPLTEWNLLTVGIRRRNPSSPVTVAGVVKTRCFSTAIQSSNRPRSLRNIVCFCPHRIAHGALHGGVPPGRPRSFKVLRSLFLCGLGFNCIQHCLCFACLVTFLVTQVYSIPGPFASGNRKL
ncbi:hypothetical protein V6N13_040974 [Hibiscus sabdariffa]|uniref:Uncharacterized protein n=1 Tax=Hibiscus sabdariffa TaxID=183260 RepID=A0ABR2RA13_9ROSI